MIYKILFLASILNCTLSYADVSLLPGESITIRGERISCNPGTSQSTTRCYCDSSGCATAYTTKGNVVLNIVTTDANRSSRINCVEYDTEASCHQAMAACN